MKAKRLNKAERIAMGWMLIEAKARCKRGEWTKWVEGNCTYKLSTAQKYMKEARETVTGHYVRMLEHHAQA